MANLLVAPVGQLTQARDAYAEFKELATAKGISYARVYTSYNTRTNKVRVKVYAVGGVAKHETALAKMGFMLIRGTHGRYSSLIGTF